MGVVIGAARVAPRPPAQLTFGWMLDVGCWALDVESFCARRRLNTKDTKERLGVGCWCGLSLQCFSTSNNQRPTSNNQVPWVHVGWQGSLNTKCTKDTLLRRDAFHARRLRRAGQGEVLWDPVGCWVLSSIRLGWTLALQLNWGGAIRDVPGQ